MNELKVFQNTEFGALGVLVIDGKEYFPATACAKVLGYKEPEKAIRTHCKGVSELDTPTPGGNQKKRFIPEGDLYRLIVRSQLPAAERFERWVFDEVLPSIRKHGLFAVDELLDNPDIAIAAFTQLKQERARRRALEVKVEEDKPFTTFARSIANSSAAILIGDFAKLAHNSGIMVGRNRLFRWLRDKRYLMPDNKPYQRYVDKGLFEVRESHISTIKGDLLKVTTLLTGKGQMLLLDALQRDFGVAVPRSSSNG